MFSSFRRKFDLVNPMPFYYGDLVQTEKFVDAIDIMQSFADEYVAMAPSKIVGD